MLPSRNRTLLTLTGIAVLAVALSVALSTGSAAGTLFQSSPPPTIFVPPTLPPPPTFEVATAAPPAPSPTPLPLSSPTPVGFLPAPTLTNPNEVFVVPPNTAGRPTASAPAADGVDAVASPAPDRSGLSTLIDDAAAALGYAWLCCGGLLLVAAAAVFVWLSRRAGPP